MIPIFFVILNESIFSYKLWYKLLLWASVFFLLNSQNYILFSRTVLGIKTNDIGKWSNTRAQLIANYY